MASVLYQSIETLSKDKGIEPAIVVGAVEDAIALATRKYYKTQENMRAEMDKETGEIRAYVFKYQAKIAMGWQEIAASISVVVKEEGGGWSVAQTMETPQGAAVQTVSLEKGTLIVRKMSVNQGPVSIVVDFAGGKATGKMSMGGQDRPV